MIQRRAALALPLLVPFRLRAQAAAATASSIIGVGPFEFPIPGSYTYVRAPGAMIVTDVDRARTFTIAFFRDASGRSVPDRHEQLEVVTRRNWEDFVRKDGGVVVREFRRRDVSSTLAIFGMASEFRRGELVDYYVQFAASTGSEVAVLIVGGRGPALDVIQELEPQVAAVKVRA